MGASITSRKKTWPLGRESCTVDAVGRIWNTTVRNLQLAVFLPLTADSFFFDQSDGQVFRWRNFTLRKPPPQQTHRGDCRGSKLLIISLDMNSINLGFKLLIWSARLEGNRGGERSWAEILVEFICPRSREMVNLSGFWNIKKPYFPPR